MLSAAALLEMFLFTFPIKITLFNQRSQLASFDLYPGVQNNSFHFNTLLWVETTGQMLCCFHVRHINEPARPPHSLTLQWELTCRPRDITPAGTAKMHFTLASFS